MKIFSMLQTRSDAFLDSIRAYLSKTLSSYNENFNSNTVFGQLLNVLGSAMQNVLSYVEDSTVEQNKYTAQRKTSIWSLAETSGYTPSTGTATSAVVKLSFLPNNENVTNIIIPNKTAILCSANGLTYNIMLPQESIVCNMSVDTAPKFLSVVEGTFETQYFVSEGGELYSKNIKMTGDPDLNYFDVSVNGTKWSRVVSLYDMSPDAEEYVVRPSIGGGVDIVFGNDENGRALSKGDSVEVTYLMHSGELGNLSPDEDMTFAFFDKLKNTLGEELDGSKVFSIDVEDASSVVSGTFSDDTETVRNMIGMTSRALVLADAKNYKEYFKRFSFVGYNRVWTEKGSMVVNSLVMKNYKAFISSGSDYFSLKESDFTLNDSQKTSIYNAISASGEQLAGVVFNIFDPEIVKYACYIYIKLKDSSYSTDYISSSVRDLVGNFFADVNSDIFIPKSDIVHLLKSNISEIDSVDVYFMSAENEQALIDKHYEEKSYSYDPSSGNYKITSKTVFLYDDENPNLGLDAHGNILLDNNDQFPVLMGGWSCKNDTSDATSGTTTIVDPITIIFE